MSALLNHFWAGHLGVFVVFLRLAGLFILIPVFSHRSIPGSARVFLALSMSVAIHPIVAPFLPEIPESLGGMVLLALGQTAMGFLMGFVAYLTFEAINLAAQFIGFQIGFGIAGLMDPQTQSQTSVLVPIHGLAALMIFLMADMHHHVLFLFVKSFEVTAQWDFSQNSELVTFIVAKVGMLFSIAIQMAAPFTVLVLCTNVAIGVLARMLPQMNILLFSFPVTILVGMAAMYVVAPDMLSYMENTLGVVTEDLVDLLKRI